MHIIEDLKAVEKKLRGIFSVEKERPDRLGEGALYSALKYTHLSRDELRSVHSERDGELYYISFSTSWLRYDCYVNAFSGEVVGCSFEPIEYEPCPYI